MINTQYNRYIPAYKRTQITDELYEVFGFKTDYEIIEKQNEKYNKKNPVKYAYSKQNKKSKKR